MLRDTNESSPAAMTDPHDDTNRSEDLLTKLHAGVAEAISNEVARRRAAGLLVYVSGSDGHVEDMAAPSLAGPPGDLHGCGVVGAE